MSLGTFYVYRVYTIRLKSLQMSNILLFRIYTLHISTWYNDLSSFFFLIFFFAHCFAPLCLHKYISGLCMHHMHILLLYLVCTDALWLLEIIYSRARLCRVCTMQKKSSQSWMLFDVDIVDDSTKTTINDCRDRTENPNR